MLHGGEIYDFNGGIEYDFSVNLNPVPCPENVKKALESAVHDIEKYPDINQRKFRESIADAENYLMQRSKVLNKYQGEKDTVSEKPNNTANTGAFKIDYKNVIGGSGASEILTAVIRAVNPSKILLPVPSFYGYEHAAGMCENCEIERVTLRAENGFELCDDFLDKITEDTDVIILGNPNNPTGRAINDTLFDGIVKKCKETKTVLIVDECFQELSTNAVSAIRYLSKYNSIFIVNAFTKLFSIPGVRVGYAVSSAENISKLRKFLPEWNLSVFAEKAGVACAKELCGNVRTGMDNEGKTNKEFLKMTVNTVRSEREYLTMELRKLGITVYDSDTCFLLIFDPTDLYSILLDKNILIRDCINFRGLRKGFYRISIKDHKSNVTLLEAIKSLKN